MLGLRFCARAFSNCGERGPLFIAVRRPLTVAASLVSEHKLQTRRLSSCGSRAQLLCGMWDLPRPGLEPVSPALAGRFSTTAPPGKPREFFFLKPFLLNTYLVFFSLFDILRNEARVMEGLHRLGIEGLSLHNVLKLNIQPSEANYAVDIRSPAISVGIL